ncbi:MAG: DUF3048 domain-containing protein [Patescibacteria group bacterium]|nr:DUF3048 domain-containing protein [Patescibacteria group bacterium]
MPKFSKNNKKKLWLIISAIFIILTIILSFVILCRIIDFYPDVFGINKPLNIFKIAGKNKIQAGHCLNCVRRTIDGVYVNEDQANLCPVAVIIENHIDARPPAGLAQANLVFEAEAEGGITRFLAVFSLNAQEQNLKEIGPVRSARPYFIDWACELSALFIHCGGSPEALVKIIRENSFNLNEFYQGDYFWRDKKKQAPHNIYISTDRINQYLSSQSANQGKFLSWQFKQDIALEERPLSSKIEIGFKNADFAVQWKYDRNNNDYLRYLAGEIHHDVSGREIRAKNVIIEYVKARIIDDELRLKMDYIGEGKAVVCFDGKCQKGIWQKKLSSSRTRFYNNDKEEFKFNAGTIWIEVVRPEIEVNY